MLAKIRNQAKSKKLETLIYNIILNCICNNLQINKKQKIKNIVLITCV